MGNTCSIEARLLCRTPNTCPILEGPKLYKRNGYYYIFAPIWRSRRGISGRVEVARHLRSLRASGGARAGLNQDQRAAIREATWKRRMDKAGSYISSPMGRTAALFTSSRSGGRTTGHSSAKTSDGASTGQPIATGPIPDHLGAPSQQRPQTSDDFNATKLRPAMGMDHNPDDTHWSLSCTAWLFASDAYAALII